MLSKKTVRYIERLVAEGRTHQEAADLSGVSIRLVADVVAGRHANSSHPVDPRPVDPMRCPECRALVELLAPDRDVCLACALRGSEGVRE